MNKESVVEAKPGERLSRARQRQKLIDACITALHQHGPSRTTIDKVVSIADMSPGIVNFYFDTKAALLVAALDHLAVEFETRVLEPVAALREKPMAALDRLIDLYLDPDVATPRKVSVWYSFWGESSSRREYSDICGKRDLAFAALVQDLIAREIKATRLTHLDADAVALGLIGCLEMMWQEIAFQEEADLDRNTAKKRCRAYLRSIFPPQIVRLPEASLPAGFYTSEAAFKADLQIFRKTWQFAGTTGDVPRAGDYVAWESATGRSVVLRGEEGALRAFANTCLHRPHALFDRHSGCVDQFFSCTADDTVYTLDGTCQSGGRLETQLLAVHNDALFITHRAEEADELPKLSLSGLGPCAQRRDLDIEANWKLVMEHWADTYFDGSKRAFAGVVPEPTQQNGRNTVSASVAICEGAEEGFSRQYYARLHAKLTQVAPCIERTLIWPNLFVESRPDGVTIRQIRPLAAARSRICTLHYPAETESRIIRALFYLARRIERYWQIEDGRIIQSTQAGIEWPHSMPSAGGPALKTFWRWLRRPEANRPANE